MLATIPSATLLGVDGTPIWVEVHVGQGLPCFNVVGLPDAACREARDRVRAAITSAGCSFPMQRVTVNLAPSGLRKAGAGLDLAIAVGVLAASEQVPADGLDRCAFLGELGLDGSLRPVPGTVPLVDALGTDAVVVPAASAAEAALVGRHRIRAVTSLVELVDALNGRAPWPDPPVPPPVDPEPPPPELADVRGQPLARLALEVAAAGSHHLLMVGPPGAGKTMLARRLPGLLPALDLEASIEVARIRSAAGVPLEGGRLPTRPPLRAPHHGASAVSLIGGGTSTMRPGELSLAARGVLFLDELGEFPTSVLEALRQPLEEGVVRVARARAAVTFPARVLLVGAMNPCPCGRAGTPGACRCSDAARARYARRLSGPLLDRFDLRVEVARPSPDALLGAPDGEGTAEVAARVRRARLRAAARGVSANSALEPGALARHAPLTPAAAAVLRAQLATGALSGRGAHRVHRVARTIADLGDHDGPVGEEHVCLALELRTEADQLLAVGR